MTLLSRVRRAFRWRLRSLLLLVAMVGLRVGVWSNDASRARVFHGDRASALARPLALLASDIDQSEPVRTRALETLAAMKSDAKPAIPELLPLLIDEFMEAGRFRRALFALFVAIGEPARPHTQAFIEDLGRRWQRWDESDASLYMALAPSQEAARDALRRVAACKSIHITVRAFAGKALRGIDPSAPELLPLTGDILMGTTLEYEWSNRTALEFVMAADLTTLRMIPKWLPGVYPHLERLRMLQEAGPTLAPIHQVPPASSRDLLRDLASRFLGSESEEVQRTGAILLANIDPEGAALHAWLAQRLSDTGDRSIAASLTCWLGPRARALTHLLFRQLLVREHLDEVTGAIRCIEQRPGTAPPNGDSLGGF